MAADASAAAAAAAAAAAVSPTDAAEAPSAAAATDAARVASMLRMQVRPVTYWGLRTLIFGYFDVLSKDGDHW